MVSLSVSRKVDFPAMSVSIKHMIAMRPFPDISPEIFTITVFGNDFALRWYALAYIVGILLGWRLVVMAVRRADLWKDNKPLMTPGRVEDLLFWVILGVILSRLLDDNWRRAIISEREDLGRFFEGIFTSPLSLVLFISVILIFVSQTPLWTSIKNRLSRKATS